MRMIEIDLMFCFLTGEEPYLDLCKCSDRESKFRFTDEGEHDSSAEELRIKMHALRKVHELGNFDGLVN